MMKRCVQGWVGWCLALAILFAQSGSPQFIVYAQEESAETEAQIANLEKLFDALEAAAKDIPRDTFDLEAALALTDLTPESILTWVRDNTYLVPYKGALRGAQGVLMDRVGNSLDRAMLLQGLMQLLGYETQLARAQLSEVQAQDILVKTKPVPAEGALPQTADTDINAELQKYVSEFDLDGAQLTQALEQANQQRETLQAEMKTRVASQTEFLMNALGNPSGDVAAEKAKQVAALQDHWWVQYQEGGVWVDLDPTMPDAVPNQKIVASGETLVATKLEELPQDLLHTLQIKVVLECALESGLTETTLVESPTLIPAQLLNQRIAVNHIPVNMPQDYDMNDSAAFEKLLLEQDRWFPVLTIGSQQLFTNDYTTSCEIGTATPPSTGTAIGGALDDALDVFGSVDGDTTAPTERVTAQWLEYTIYVPGEADQITRRQIFDVLGASARAAGESFVASDAQRLAWRLSLLGGTDILPVVGHLPSEYAVDAVAQSLLANRKVLLDSVSGADPNATPDVSSSPSGQLYAFALSRQGFLQTPGAYLAQPNVFSYHRQMWRDEAGNFNPLEGFDIVNNTVAVDLKTTPDSFAARLSQGIQDTNAEALVGRLECQRDEKMLCESLRNSGETLAASQQQGVQWTTVRTAQEVDSLAISDDLKARAREDVAQGYVVVLPSQSVANADNAVWWRIDPTTGQSLGMGDRGWGQEIAEYAFIVRVIGFGFCAYGARSSTGSAVAFCFVGLFIGGFIGTYGAGHAQGIALIIEALSYGFGGLGVGN
jgi:hypothetical protein